MEILMTFCKKMQKISAFGLEKCSAKRHFHKNWMNEHSLEEIKAKCACS